MFNPQMMEAAQKMMANMKPEDMSRMSQMAANMDPKVMENMMKSMGGAPPGVDVSKAAEQMKNMSPEELRQGMAQAQTQMNGQKQYYLSAAEVLKKDGNDLIKSEKFSEALEKYNRGIDNLKGHSGTEVSTMLVNLHNNSALCHLKTKDYKAALNSGEEALKVDSKSFKAFLRRGQAKQGMGKLQEAVSDVRRAHELAPNDKSISDVLETFRGEMKAKGIEESHEVSSTWQTSEASGTSSSSSAPVSLTPGASSPAADTNDFAKMSEKFAENPDMLKQATEAMSKMSSDDIANMMKAAGSSLPPGMSPETVKSQVETLQKNPEMMKMAMDQMQNMPEEERKRMLQMRGGGGGGGAAAPNPANMTAMFENPDMIKQAAEMAKNMSPEDMKRMNIGSPEEADMMRQAAEQMASNPDMLKQMSEMMKNMPPEQMEAMMKMRGAGGMGGGAGGAAGMAGGAGAGMDPSAMMNDPDMMKATEEMMKSMSPEMLSSMMKASGMDVSEDKAKMIAKFLPWMMRGMRLFGHVKKGWKHMWSTKGRIAIAVLVLMIALYQHYRSSSPVSQP